MVENTLVGPFMVRDLEALRVISDPARVRLVAVFSEGPRSVKEAASILGVAPSKLYYHVDLLERHGFIVVDSTRVVSGITEKRYRAVSRDIRVDRKLLAIEHPGEMLDALLGAVLDATRTEAERSVRSGALAIEEDAPSPRSGLFSRAQVRLTPQQATQMREDLDRLIAHAQANVPPSDDVVQYDLTIAYFPLATGE
jgi:DNA-binding transcriptional ArsR family regulator